MGRNNFPVASADNSLGVFEPNHWITLGTGEALNTTDWTGFCCEEEISYQVTGWKGEASAITVVITLAAGTVRKVHPSVTELTFTGISGEVAMEVMR